MDVFLQKLDKLDKGYSEGFYKGRRYGTTYSVSRDGKRHKLYAQQLGGNDHISFNLYIFDGKSRLKPCEMPAQKICDFVAGYESLNGS